MVKAERVRKLNSHIYKNGPVLYWMSRDIRAEDNWALLHAQELALAHDAPLLVLYNLAPGFMGGGLRQHAFKLQALESVEAQLKDKGIPFFLCSGKDTEKDIVAFVEQNGVGAVVTDFSPLRLPRAWVAYVRKHLEVPFYGVDAHNIVPCASASPKQEFGAYTLRPKLYKLLPEYLEEFSSLIPHPHAYTGKVPAIDWDALLHAKGIDASVAPVDWIDGSHKSAEAALARFIEDGLPRYADARNDPNENAQSNLSPYLHYGVLSAERIALAILERVDAPIETILAKAKNKAKVDPKKELDITDHAGAYLEELIVRRELSDNFCFYNEQYDSVEGFPEWAKKSHEAHKDDKREYLYTDEQFEQGKTHEALWNAAQLEMVKTGKMHGYMRMYWAKKILEWTPSPEEAMRVAIYLNDKYELDGRDPNGYAGIAWSIGGVHDRAWFERPVFGQIRYMNANGCKAKFDTDAYITKWTGAS
jgi:deoxyribodipyrimidine photo-lyase